MKKIGKLSCIIIIAVIFVFFSGCGVYDKIDLEYAYKEISALKTSTLDLNSIGQLIEIDPYFGTLEDIELEELNINLDYVVKRAGRPIAIVKQEKKSLNSVPLTSYMIIKPEEDKKELLKEQIDAYYEKILAEYSEKEEAAEETKEHLSNVMMKEYDGYLIYILSNDNEAVWELIEKNAHSLLFQDTKQMTEKEVEKEFLVKEKDIKEFLAVKPTKNTSASFYIIVKPKNGKTDDVKKALNQYMKNLEKKWSTYLPEEYQLVKNRMDTEIGSYLVYIVSKDNELVLQSIKDAIVKKN